MPRRYKTKYDTLEVPYEHELIRIYMSEGMSLEDATIQAKSMHASLNGAVATEARFWRKIREHEKTVGLEVESPIFGGIGYAT